MKITVQTTLFAPIETVWTAYTTPADIVQWNAASSDWHTTEASVDLRVGGRFSSRMEAKDGSMGFDFAGIYTEVEPLRRIAYTMGESLGEGRGAVVEFIASDDGASVTVRVSFDAETIYPEEQQRAGWQAILDSFALHVHEKQASNSSQ